MPVVAAGVVVPVHLVTAHRVVQTVIEVAKHTVLDVAARRLVAPTSLHERAARDGAAQQRRSSNLALFPSHREQHIVRSCWNTGVAALKAKLPS